MYKNGIVTEKNIFEAYKWFYLSSSERKKETKIYLNLISALLDKNQILKAGKEINILKKKIDKLSEDKNL